MFLSCIVQKYDWGMRGNSSEVARIKYNNDKTYVIDELHPYAELWMGTHPTGPSNIENTNELLSHWLEKNPESIGYVPSSCDCKSSLPFMFKVLSIAKALSIQAHPDKALARELNANYPDIYKDDNHKPEMVVALTTFQALCGFRQIVEIVQHFEAYPELKYIVGDQNYLTLCKYSSSDNISNDTNSQTERTLMSQMFKSFMTCTDSIAKQQLVLLISRLKQKKYDDDGASSEDVKYRKLDQLMIRLYSDYPDDLGVFSPLLLNYIELQPGESFFMGENEPHAYIHGDCIECMALSDNVVRAGLTPKMKDVDTLVNMLTYKCGTPSIITPIHVDETLCIYRPPCSEFEVERIELSSGTYKYTFPARNCAVILLLLRSIDCSLQVRNNGMEEVSLQCKQGSILFVPANSTVVYHCSDTCTSTTNDSSVFYLAHVNLSVI